MDQFDSIAVIVEMNTIWIGVVISKIMVILYNKMMGNDEIQISI
ncbi:MAG TPA: hypothetical protein VE818_11285 [Nitrososphaeraceae archaeon]|jgi:hypothetical protein|nr:hypothetical protein [Nitrososphaeraceae archaeon]